MSLFNYIIRIVASLTWFFVLQRSHFKQDSLQTSLKQRYGSDSLSLLAIMVINPSSIDEAVESVAFYLSPRSQLKSIKSIECSLKVKDSGVSFWFFTGLVIANVNCIAETVEWFTLYYRSQSSQLKPINSFEISFRERAGSFYLWWLTVLVESVASFTLYDSTSGCQEKSITR